MPDRAVFYASLLVHEAAHLELSELIRNGKRPYSYKALEYNERYAYIRQLEFLDNFSFEENSSMYDYVREIYQLIELYNWSRDIPSDHPYVWFPDEKNTLALWDYMMRSILAIEPERILELFGNFENVRSL